MGARPLIAVQHFAKAENLLAALTPYGLGAEKDLLWNRGDLEQWIFRGQADATWRLTPGAARKNALLPFIAGQRKLTLTPITTVLFEELLVHRFASGALRRGYEVPGLTEARSSKQRHVDYAKAAIDFPPEAERGMYALAQHYGVPTRLVDWTLSPFAAAYFAAIEPAKRPFQTRSQRHLKRNLAVFALNYRLVSHSCERWDPGAMLVSAPGSSIPNLRAQGGLFTLVRAKTSPAAKKKLPTLDVLLSMPEHISEVRSGDPFGYVDLPLLYKFTLPHREAGRLLYFLDLLDVNVATLFPGRESVREHMAEEWFRQKTRPGRE